jgi:pyruvate/2-oxoglutarate dehydrogenase complex dihydrolipoamide dehydrogenase (E3) component
MADLLAKEDPELVALLRRQLEGEGVGFHERTKMTGVEPSGTGVALLTEREGKPGRLEGSHLLLAAGRRANVADLGLDAAGIAYGQSGITVDRGLRTSNRRVYAIGDAAGGLQFTHVAGYHAGIVIRSALFRLPARVDYRAVPRVTYTDPELAQVGLSEQEAWATGQAVQVLRWPLAENDRAQAELTTDGLVKVIAGKRGRVLGAAILAPHAGELIQPWILAVANGLKLSAVANMIAPYPTLGEGSKRAAGSFYTPLLFNKRMRRLVRLLRRLG